MIDFETEVTTKLKLNEETIAKVIKDRIEEESGRKVTNLYIHIGEKCEGYGMSETYTSYLEYAEATLGDKIDKEAEARKAWLETNRTHEECDGCPLVKVMPAPCKGHPEGPVACREKDELLLLKELEVK